MKDEEKDDFKLVDRRDYMENRRLDRLITLFYFFVAMAFTIILVGLFILHLEQTVQREHEHSMKNYPQYQQEQLLNQK